MPDLAERYGVRVWRDEVSWPELRDMIMGLLAVPSRLRVSLEPEDTATR